MPGDTNWGKGLGQPAELGILEGWLNEADSAALRDCAEALWTGPDDLITTQAKVLGGLRRVPKELSRVADNWFGLTRPPMWFWDCTLSLAQMHLVLKESRARTCILLAAAKDARQKAWCEMWVQCGHARLQTVLTWEQAAAADTGLGGRNGWLPAKPPSGLIREWIFIPFNSGYAWEVPESGAKEEAQATLRSYEARVKAGERPEAVMPNYESIRDIVQSFSSTEFPWRGTVLAVPADDKRRPKPKKAVRSGLSLTYVRRVLEPPTSTRAYHVPKMTRRKVISPGIKISWAGAPDGVIRTRTRITA